VLNIAVEHAAKRPVGDAWVWHRRTEMDISPLSAVTLAHHVVSTVVPEPTTQTFGMWR
jgi:hypothetical protein